MYTKLYEECRPILSHIKKKMQIVTGGSQGTGRYLMRDTKLYFRLGQILNRYATNNAVLEEQKMDFVRRATADLLKEFRLHEKTNIFVQSMNFVDSFKDEEYFNEVSKLCKHSFNQIREVQTILAKDNPLGVTKEDLDSFKRQLSSRKLTYKQMRELCNMIRYKYGQYKLRVDYLELEDNFESIDTDIRNAIRDTTEDRSKLRMKLGGESFIKRLRYLLTLLARENVFALQFAKHKEELKAVSFPKSTHHDFVRLYTTLLQFTNADERDRNSLRKHIKPYDMGQMHSMLKALENETQYREYKSTQEIFENIQI